MKFLKGLLGDGGYSHKRFISLWFAFVGGIISLWYAYKNPDKVPVILTPILVFITVMSGVATVAQIVALVRGGNVPNTKDLPTDTEPANEDGPGGSSTEQGPTKKP